MSSNDENIFEEEWNRAISNPDNMIVSDSLMERLAGTDLEEDSASSDTYLQCTIISTDGDVVSGRTASFKQSEEERSVVFETTHATANSMLRFEDLKEVIFSVPHENPTDSGVKPEVVWTVTSDETVSKKTELYGQNDALITISIERVKDTDDPNSYTVTVDGDAI